MRLVLNIKNFKLRPVKSKKMDCFTQRDKFDVEFEPVQLISVEIDDKMVDQYFVKKTEDDKVILKYKHGDKTVHQ